MLAKRSGPAASGPLNAFRCTIAVRSIKDAMAAVEAAGGKLRSAVVEIPDVGKVCEFADTEESAAAFSAAFKQCFGVPPSRYGSEA